MTDTKEIITKPITLVPQVSLTSQADRIPDTISDNSTVDDVVNYCSANTALQFFAVIARREEINGLAFRLMTEDQIMSMGVRSKGKIICLQNYQKVNYIYYLVNISGS
jgi:hypothetical protein